MGPEHGARYRRGSRRSAALIWVVVACLQQIDCVEHPFLQFDNARIILTAETLSELTENSELCCFRVHDYTPVFGQRT